MTGYIKSGHLTESLIGTSKGTHAVTTCNDFKRFKTYKGLPPDGEPGIFLGWSADHQPWTLVWQSTKNCWGAVGWEMDHESTVPDRVVYHILIGDHAGFIVEWAFSPVCPPMKVWPEEVSIRHDSWQTLQDWKEKFTSDLYKKKGSLITSTNKRGT